MSQTVLKSLFPSSVFGFNTSILAELQMRSLRNLYLGQHSKARGLSVVVAELLDQMRLDDTTQQAVAVSALHKPASIKAVNASKSKIDGLRKKAEAAAVSYKAAQALLASEESKISGGGVGDDGGSANDDDNEGDMVISQWGSGRRAVDKDQRARVSQG